MDARIVQSCLLCFFCGCGTAMFTVKSDPLQADVYVMNPATNEKKPLGKTPLEIPNQTLKDAAGAEVPAGSYYTVLIEKPGYITEKLQVPATRFGTLVTALDVKMKQGQKEERLASEILNHLFIAAKMARAKQFERAQIEVDKLLNDVPDFPRALSMRASIYYMQKNYVEALKWYEEALKHDPEMDDATQMIAKIRGKGTTTTAASARSPASSTKTGGTGQ